jgi:hypothetical protein
MIRSKSREWSIQVYHDLERLTQGWQSRLEPNDSVGVMHIGFDRPLAKEFDDVADHFAGRILITGSGVHAMPAAFLTSKNNIGIVGNLPIFLGIQGWGYSIEDTTVERDQSPSRPRDFEDWIADFVAEVSERGQALVQHEIYSEAEYLKKESLLPTAMRIETGLFRYQALLGNATDDPCSIANAAPPWLLSRPFDTLDLTVRVSNVLVNYKIRTVGDLANWSLIRLLKLPNFGRTSARDLRESLEQALREGPFDAEEKKEIAEAEQTDLLSCVRRSLLNVTDRERDIIMRRMGLTGKSETLQQIGEDYDVTRERIRQIESKVLQRLIKDNVWDEILAKKIEALLVDRSFPLPLKGVEAADTWFAGVGDFSDALRYLLDNLCLSDVHLLDVEGVHYFSFMDQATWDAAASEARRLLATGAEKGWTESNCRLLVGHLLPEKSREFRPLLWDRVSCLCHFATEDGESRLAAYGRGAEHIVEAVLTESDEPLHYSTISALATDRAGKPIDIRRAHSAAASVGYLLGRGLYGVDRHLPDMQTLQYISDEAEEIVGTGPVGRQWHTSEILSAIVERGNADVLGTGFDKYTLDIALQKVADLKRLGRMTWMIADGNDETARIDIRQAVIALLQQAGRPLHTDEIRQRLIALRGVNQHFQIVAADPVLRVGVGIWGLNDRDVVIKRASQPRFLDGLVGILNDRKTGIHISELERSTLTSASGLTARTLFSLACTDARLSVNPGDYLYLEDWGGPRRESVSEAAKIIMERAAGPLPIDDIMSLVEARIRRRCERTSLSHCLRAIECEFDAKTGKWSLMTSETADDDIMLSA